MNSMVAVDSNVLIYAHRRGAPEHRVALEVLRELWEGTTSWSIAWPSIYEFARVMTHPLAVEYPFTTSNLIGAIEQILKSPSVVMLGHTDRHWRTAVPTMSKVQPIANAAFDIQIASILLENGVTSIYTRDKAFAQLGLTVINPF